MNWYAVFKKELVCQAHFYTYVTYEKGKKYKIELKEDDVVYVRQPNSPKDKTWVTAFDKANQEEYFDMVEE